MNLRLGTHTLWHASHGQWRWVIVACYALMAVVTVAVLRGAHDPSRLNDLWIFFGIGNVGVWMLLASTALRLTIDANQLLVPSIQRSVVTASLLLVLFTIVLPTVVIGLVGGAVGMSAVWLALCAMGGFALVLVPGYFFLIFAFLLPLLHSLWRALYLPGLPNPSTTNFAIDAGLAALVLLLFSVLRWHQLLQSEHPYARGINMPIAWVGDRFTADHWNVAPVSHTGWKGNSVPRTRRRLLGMYYCVDLRKIGPQHVVNSLRVALAGLFLPLTSGAIVWVVVFFLLTMLAIGMFMTVVVMDITHSHGLLQTLAANGGMPLIVWMVALACPQVASSVTSSLRQRWDHSNAELPLLALLPGLNNAGTLRRNLLLVTLMPPLCLQAALLILLVAIIGPRLGASAELLMVIVPLVCAGVIVAVTLCILGGRPLGLMGTKWLMGVTNMLVIGSLVAAPALVSMGDRPWNGIDIILSALGALWLLLGLLMLWLGRCGWRGLQQRPHPFFPN